MIRHYQRTFKNPKDILEFIENDLKQMGLDKDERKRELNQAFNLLKGAK